MTSPESNYSATVKTARGSLVTVRGDDADQFLLHVRAYVMHELAAEIAMLEDVTLGSAAAAAPVATAPAPAVAAPATPATPAAPAGALEIVPGKYGDSFTYGHPDAPALPDGRGLYIMREWQAKSGKKMRAWIDPAKGPRPFTPGADEAPLVWAN